MKVQKRTYYINKQGTRVRLVYATYPWIGQVRYVEYAIPTGDILNIHKVCPSTTMERWVARARLLDESEVEKYGIGRKSYTYHYHKCGYCGAVWSHDSLSPDFGDEDEEHICSCGAEVTLHYIPTPQEKSRADKEYKKRVGYVPENINPQ